jgi:hypothetical protein
MRRIGLTVLLVLVFATFVASEETKGSKAIGEYPIGEFAVKGQVEQQLNQLVAEIKGKMADGDRLQITVVGSADSTGVSAANDRLARDRAEQVAAVFSANFPEAKIIAWSKGDAENVRQVRVEYKIISTPIPAPVPEPAKPKKPSDGLEDYVVGAFILLAIFILLFSIFWGKRAKKSRVKKAETGIQWINLEVNGEKYSYSIGIVVKNGVWCSPFTSRSGSQICRDSKRGIIESLKGCLKKDEFRLQKFELIRQGIIRVTGQR